MSATVEEDLVKLLAAINDLPASRLTGSRQDRLTKHLTPGLSKDPDPLPVFPLHKDGHYSTFNLGWERAFHKEPGEPHEALFSRVCRGKHGLILAHAWASYYVGIILPQEQGMIQLWVGWLLRLIDDAPVAGSTAAPPDGDSDEEEIEEITKDGNKKRKKGGKDKSNSPQKKSKTTEVISGDAAARNGDAPEDVNEGGDSAGVKRKISDKDKSDKPKKKAKKAAATGDEPEASKTKPKPKPAPKKKCKHATASKSKPQSSSKQSDSSSDSEPETAKGRVSVKLTWALSQYSKPKVATKGPQKSAIWKFTCRYCTKYRTSPHTEDVTEWDEETLKIDKTSNFISHADECKGRPPAQSWEEYQTARDRAAKGLPPLPASSDPSPAEAQWGIMQKFIQRGIDEPAKVVMNSSYRKHLVEAIVEDDLPFSLAEKGGSLRLFQHLAPRGIKARIPHQTVRRDIDVLHKVLDAKLKGIIKDNDSKFSLASDIVTTKNQVHAFCGTVITFIDDDWVLREYALDLIPLDGDHSGNAVGKLIFKSLKRRKIADRLMGSATDNASSNGPMNRTIARKCAAVSSESTCSRNIQIGCGGHVTNIVAQKFMGTLGMSPTLAEVDLYNENRKFPLVYDLDTDPQVIEDMTLMAKEIAKEGGKKVASDTESGSEIEEVVVKDPADDSESDGGSDSEGSETDEDDRDTWLDEDDGDSDSPAPAPKPKTAKPKKTKKTFTSVDNVHQVSVHILRSEIRRKKARRIIHRKIPQKSRHLVFIRSMKVRWNTVLAELERAQLLQPAFDSFVNGLPDGLTGKPRKVVLTRKKKWEMHSADWESVDRLVKSLQILKKVTLEFSKKHVPTICKVLPLYKLMEVKLDEQATDHILDDPALSSALRAGAEMATKYIEKALVGDYALLGAVLHPAICLAYFQGPNWDPTIAERARLLLLAIVKQYARKYKTSSTGLETAPSGSASEPDVIGNVFAMAIALEGAESATAVAVDGKDEVDLYFGNVSPVAADFDDPLGWWKQMQGTLGFMAHVARDILAIPGVSISVECLFSSVKHTLSDARSSMTAQTASVDIVTKEWLKSGLSEGVNYMNFVKPHKR